MITAPPSRRAVPHLVLASGSPRRRELLEKPGYEFEIVLPSVSEVLADWVTIRETTAWNAMRKAMEVANQHGCSRIIVHAPRKRGLLLGLLNQRRWWTVTRARLCAQHIIRERLGECGLAEHS